MKARSSGCRRACATALIVASGAMVVLLHPCAPAIAQGQPDRPVRLVIPHPPGGGTDITAQAIAGRLGEALQQPVVLENRPGATGMIGPSHVARSSPGGQTVLFGAASEMAINTRLYRRMACDRRTDLEPVSLIAVFPLVLVSSAGSRLSLRVVLDRARTQPGTVTCGSVGAGSPQHLAGERLAPMSRPNPSGGNNLSTLRS